MWTMGQAVVDPTSLGAAGIMGAMWLWERFQSRKRDEQLDAAHAKIMAQGVTIEQLVDVVTANTQAVTELKAQTAALLDRLDRLAKTEK